MKLIKIVDQISPNQNLPTIFQLLVGAEGIPIKTSYKLGKLAVKVNKEFQLFNSLRNKKITEYGEDVYLDKDGNDVTDEEKKKDIQPVPRVKKENEEKFFAEISELGDQEVDMEIPEIILEDLGEPIFKANDLENPGKTKEVKLTPVEIYTALSWLIKE